MNIEQSPNSQINMLPQFSNYNFKDFSDFLLSCNTNMIIIMDTGTDCEMLLYTEHKELYIVYENALTKELTIAMKLPITHTTLISKYMPLGTWKGEII